MQMMADCRFGGRQMRALPLDSLLSYHLKLGGRKQRREQVALRRKDL